MSVSLFPQPITGALFTVDEPDGVAVTILGLVRPDEDGAELRAIFVDEDGYIHEDEARQLEFTSAVPVTRLELS